MSITRRFLGLGLVLLLSVFVVGSETFGEADSNSKLPWCPLLEREEYPAVQDKIAEYISALADFLPFKLKFSGEPILQLSTMPGRCAIKWNLNAETQSMGQQNSISVDKIGSESQYYECRFLLERDNYALLEAACSLSYRKPEDVLTAPIGEKQAKQVADKILETLGFANIRLFPEISRTELNVGHENYTFTFGRKNRANIPYGGNLLISLQYNGKLDHYIHNFEMSSCDDAPRFNTEAAITKADAERRKPQPDGKPWLIDKSEWEIFPAFCYAPVGAELVVEDVQTTRWRDAKASYYFYSNYFNEVWSNELFSRPRKVRVIYLVEFATFRKDGNHEKVLTYYNVYDKIPVDAVTGEVYYIPLRLRDACDFVPPSEANSSETQP